MKKISQLNEGMWGSALRRSNTDELRKESGKKVKTSFGFDIIAEDYVVSPDGRKCTWTVREVKLYEVSVVTFPAYEATAVEARSDSAQRLSKARLERRKKDLFERMKHKC